MRPVFQEVAMVGGLYPAAGTDEAAACSLCGGMAGANSVVRRGVGSISRPNSRRRFHTHWLTIHHAGFPARGVTTPTIGVDLLIFGSLRRRVMRHDADTVRRHRKR